MSVYIWVFYVYIRKISRDYRHYYTRKQNAWRRKHRYYKGFNGIIINLTVKDPCYKCWHRLSDYTNKIISFGTFSFSDVLIIYAAPGNDNSIALNGLLGFWTEYVQKKNVSLNKFLNILDMNDRNHQKPMKKLKMLVDIN